MTRAASALFLGASAMFATMYSTQAILPELERGLHAGPAAAGLSITVVVVAVAVAGWVHGPLSDRIGRVRVMTASAALIVLPTALLPLAPNLGAFLALRALQGVLMPGLLVVAVPYVQERFTGSTAGVAMGAYTSSLVVGGLVGRVGPALLASAAGWRWALAALAVLPAAGAAAMWAWLPRDTPAGRHLPLPGVVREHARNRLLVTNAVCAGGVFFAFVGVFTYATHRLTGAPFRLSVGEAGLVYGVWLVGAAVPAVGGLAVRVGPHRLLPGLVAAAIVGACLTLADRLPLVVAGLGLMAAAMFSTVTTCQLLIPRLASHHRGTAASLHLTVYYLLGGLGAYLPGLWEPDGWRAVVAACLPPAGLALAAALVLAGSRPGPAVAGVDVPGVG
jgi:MFS transporter, YNFM family, putative membrane transport protein